MDGDDERVTVPEPSDRQRRARGRSRVPAPPRPATGWLVMTVAMLALAAGVARGNALLLAGGLVLAVTAMPFLQPPRTPRRR